MGRPCEGGHKMAELSRPVGLGLAARGRVADAVAWAQQARRAGLDSVWVHDSYFERDAVTYISAIASQVGGIRVAMGALNPLTRHPVLVAMTVSAIDDMAPGRVILGMGTGLPLRLAQMGIPYTPEAGVEAVSRAIDTMRALWRGERVPAAAPGLPPVQPMFPPVHRVPVYVAAYRSAFLELAGQKADGYLARPAESIPSLAWMLCGTRDEVASRAADYHEAGMTRPVLQPVVQEEEHVRDVLAAAVEYGVAAAAPPGRGAPTGPSAGAARGPGRPGLDEQRLGIGARIARRVAAWGEIARPFSFTASVVPVAAAGALAAVDRRLSWPLFLAALAAGV